MHLNTPPTRFEGPWDRKIGFRAPGPEKNAQVLLNYVCHQYDMLAAVGPAWGRGGDGVGPVSRRHGAARGMPRGHQGDAERAPRCASGGTDP